MSICRVRHQGSEQYALARQPGVAVIDSHPDAAPGFFVSQGKSKTWTPAKTVRRTPSAAKIYRCLENSHAK